MKKVVRFILKSISILALSFVAMVLGLFILLYSMHTVRPSVSQLEKACGVRFPSFTITDKEVNVGNCFNYEYTVTFRKSPGPEVWERIEYLCEHGKTIYDFETGESYNPWSRHGGNYVFSIENADDHGGYHFPPNVRWMTLRLSKDSDAMYIRYSLDD